METRVLHQQITSTSNSATGHSRPSAAAACITFTVEMHKLVSSKLTRYGIAKAHQLDGRVCSPGSGGSCALLCESILSVRYVRLLALRADRLSSLI